MDPTFISQFKYSHKKKCSKSTNGWRRFTFCRFDFGLYQLLIFARDGNLTIFNEKNKWIAFHAIRTFDWTTDNVYDDWQTRIQIDVKVFEFSVVRVVATRRRHSASSTFAARYQLLWIFIHSILPDNLNGMLGFELCECSSENVFTIAS